MASTETEFTRDDVDDLPLPQPMPDDLKERGWRMSRSEGKFKAKNDRLGLYSLAVATPEEAIHAARELDAGKKMIVTPEGTSFQEREIEAPIADFPLSAETEKSALTEESQPEPKPEHVPPANNAMVPVERIRTDGGTQPRDEIDQTVVDRYAQDYRDGAIFPLIVVFNDGRNYWLADGFHRLFAFKNANPDAVYMTVDLRAGTQRDAVLYSLGANATHGLPRSNADKRRAVMTLLQDPEWSNWSDNVVAKKALVSQPFVSSLRRELSQNVLSDRLPAAAIDVAQDIAQDAEREAGQPGQIETPPLTTKRIGSDGIARDVTNIGRKARVFVEESDDVIPAENDISVEEDPQEHPGTPAETDESKPILAVTPARNADIELWQNGTIELHLRLNPKGKENPGTAIVSGKHTNTNPVFLSCTAADLQPMPPAIKRIILMIQEAFENRGKTQPAATKAKKKSVARGKKKSTKKPAKPSPKKKPANRPKPKPRVKARKK